MNKRDFLWEIGLEEVPARLLPAAIQQLDKLSREALSGAGLSFTDLRVYATPRRLALYVTGLDEHAADTVSEAKGPSKKAAYDAAGQPTRALQGFAKSQGLDIAALGEKEINGVLYVYAVKQNAGRPAMELLPELLPAIMAKLYFPKPMRWGYHDCHFVRPVHWLICLFGQDVVPMRFAGVESGRVSRGHRLLGSDQIRIQQPADYAEALRANFVIVDQAERQALCWQQIQAVAASLGGHTKADQELLEEVTYLVEYPTALSGRIEEKYLRLPKELVITPMREHQRYFPVYNGQDGLLPYFITVRNGDARFLEIVAAGNEKVLRARLADAEFFYDEDLRDKMDDKVADLSKVVFHEKLGTMGQKVARVVALAVEIGRTLGYSQEELAQTRRAAYLAKADLGSRVVYEFPELQGVIGEYYANAAGEDPVVAQAIREHYLPRFAGDELPRTKAGVAVALADKIDSICGFLAIDLAPTGSQDPFALRRAAAGCVQIIIRHQLVLNLRNLLPFAFAQVERDAPALAGDQAAEEPKRMDAMVRFLHQRLETFLGDEGVGYDVVNAVQRVDVEKADLFAGLRRAKALADYRRNERFANLLGGFNRAANLLRASKLKQLADQLQVDPALFAHPTEQALYDALQKARAQIAPLAEQGEYAAALDAASQVRPALDAFFDAVMVMDENEAVRRNRLALLKELVALTDQVGDLSKIVEA